jgi:hypothetical protein
VFELGRNKTVLIFSSRRDSLESTAILRGIIPVSVREGDDDIRGGINPDL